MSIKDEKNYKRLSFLLSCDYQGNVTPNNDLIRETTAKLVLSISDRFTSHERETHDFEEDSLVETFRRLRKCPYKVESVYGLDLRTIHLSLIDITKRDLENTKEPLRLTPEEIAYIAAQL